VCKYLGLTTSHTGPAAIAVRAIEARFLLSQTPTFTRKVIPPLIQYI